jgi:hypothetical protein
MPKSPKTNGTGSEARTSMALDATIPAR